MTRVSFSSFHALILMLVTNVAAFQPVLRQHEQLRVTSSLMMSTAAPIDGGANMIQSILKKPSKVLTVGVEYAVTNNNVEEKQPLSQDELTIMSMQLRKSKVSAIWCSDLDTLSVFAREQETARGNFPGPCPVIFSGGNDDAAAAVEAGASAVVCSAECLTNNQVVPGCEIIWKVSSTQEVQTILEKTDNSANAFWLDDVAVENFGDVASSLPTGSLCIASLAAMQPDGAEIETGRELKKLGCASVMVKQACVGDAEDTKYAQFVVNGLTSKASSEFKFSGLTGSTNGHFGGIQSSETVKWRRTEQ